MKENKDRHIGTSVCISLRKTGERWTMGRNDKMQCLKNFNSYNKNLQGVKVINN